MKDYLGDWQATSDIPTRMGVSVFTIPAGAIVSVTQVDPDFKKVLVSAGSRLIDWKHESFLNHFVRRDYGLSLEEE